MQYLLLTTRLDNSRIQNSLHLLKEIGVMPKLVFGIEKGNLNDDVKNIVLDPSAGGLTPGEAAVALSHLKCLRMVIESREPAIIMEDDIRLWVEGGVTAEMVRHAWNTIPVDDTDHECFAKWHIWNPPLEKVEEDCTGAYKVHRRVKLPTYGNQCYYVSVRFAEYFYNNFLPVRAAADVIWRFPPDGHDFIYRHYFRSEDDDGLIWHNDDSSIKD